MLSYYKNVAEVQSQHLIDRPTILVLNKSDSGSELIEHLESKYRVNVELVRSFDEFFSDTRLNSMSYSGIVVDLLTHAQFTQPEHAAFHSLMDAYSICLIRRNSKKDWVCFHPAKAEKCNIEDFFAFCSGKGPARRIRLQRRYKVQLHLSIDLVEKAKKIVPAKAIFKDKSVSINASEGGMFLITSQEYSLGDKVALTIPTLGDDQPIVAEVRWVSPWEHDGSGLPGIGVQFLDISPRQKNCLRELLNISETIQ